MARPDRKTRDPHQLDKPGDKVRVETHRSKMMGTVKKVKPDGTRIVRTPLHTIIKKKPEDLK